MNIVDKSLDSVLDVYKYFGLVSDDDDDISESLNSSLSIKSSISGKSRCSTKSPFSMSKVPRVKNIEKKTNVEEEPVKSAGIPQSGVSRNSGISEYITEKRENIDYIGHSKIFNVKPFKGFETEKNIIDDKMAKTHENDDIRPTYFNSLYDSKNSRESGIDKQSKYRKIDGIHCDIQHNINNNIIRRQERILENYITNDDGDMKHNIEVRNNTRHIHDSLSYVEDKDTIRENNSVPVDDMEQNNEVKHKTRYMHDSEAYVEDKDNSREHNSVPIEDNNEVQNNTRYIPESLSYVEDKDQNHDNINLSIHDHSIDTDLTKVDDALSRLIEKSQYKPIKEEVIDDVSNSTLFGFQQSSNSMENSYNIPSEQSPHKLTNKPNNFLIDHHNVSSDISSAHHVGNHHNRTESPQKITTDRISSKIEYSNFIQLKTKGEQEKYLSLFNSHFNSIGMPRRESPLLRQTKSNMDLTLSAINMSLLDFKNQNKYNKIRDKDFILEDPILKKIRQPVLYTGRKSNLFSLNVDYEGSQIPLNHSLDSAIKEEYQDLKYKIRQR